jgi:hypothetical protein
MHRRFEENARALEPIRSFNERVKMLAYLKWEQAGKPIGKDLEFWIEAEKELEEVCIFGHYVGNY